MERVQGGGKEYSLDGKGKAGRESVQWVGKGIVMRDRVQCGGKQ
jgi:hypothetical protein